VNEFSKKTIFTALCGAILMEAALDHGNSRIEIVSFRRPEYFATLWPLPAAIEIGPEWSGIRNHAAGRSAFGR
jgi:hypothetical protein